MIPKSLSATSVQVFEACPARWVAEYFLRAPQPSSTHADLGTACHYALEFFVKNGYWVDHKNNYDTLVSAYTDEYERLFDDPSRYDEGLGMLLRWWERQDWAHREVLSTEVKENFAIKANGEEVIFNYIWDRCDSIANGDGTFDVEVVDYKTISRPVSPEGLKNKIQARCYGLAAQIKYPEARRTWVTFDLLRYEPVGIVFSREENIATYRYLQRTFRRILEMEQSEAPEQLNTECRWCIRKQECDSLTRHVDVGGALSITDPKEAAERRYLLENQKKAVEAAMGELDEFILNYAETNELLEFDTDLLDVAITARRTRALDSQRAMQIVGPDLLAEYGSLGVTAVDKLLKDSRLTKDQRSDLKDLIRYKYGEPGVKITPKNPIDE